MSRDCLKAVCILGSWLVIALSVACGASPVTDSAPASSPPSGERDAAPATISTDRLRRGIDVSGHSGSVDWPAVAAEGHGFAFVKATEGVDLKDPAFDDHWQAMHAAGILRGAYHFFVTEDDPDAQAQFFIDTVRLEPGDLAPVVDIELLGHDTDVATLPARLRTFVDRIAGHYGVKPIIYTSAGFWDRHLTDTFGDHPLWVAEYEVDAPRVPKGWSTWHLWQWQGDATLPGVEKGADLSRVNPDGVDPAVLLVPPPGVERR